MITVFEYLEDFDNAELSVEEWIEVLEEAVLNYNEEYNTNYNPDKTVKRYIRSLCTRDE